MDALEDNVKILRRLGLFETWKDGNHNWIANTTYFILKTTISVNYYFVAVGGPIFTYNNSQNTKIIFNALNNMLSALLANVKILVVSCQNETLRNLIDSLRDMSKYHSALDGQTKKILNSTRKMCYLLTITMPKTVFVLYFIAFYGAMFTISQQSKEEIEKITTVWVPFNIHTPYVFEALGFLFAIGVTYVVIVIVAIASLISSMMLHLLAQFQILNHNLRNLKGTAILNVERRLEITSEAFRQGPGVIDGAEEKIVGGDIDVEVAHSARGGCDIVATLVQNTMLLGFQTVGQGALAEIALMERKNRLISEEMERVLKQCIDYHCDIIRFTRKFELFFEVIFGSILFANLTINVLILVLPAMLSDGSAIAMLAPRVMYFLIQLAVYCYLADKVTEESSKVREAISSCDWLESSGSFKKSMLVVIAMANQPIAIKTAGFVQLSADTLRNVMKTAFSYYTVLSEFT